MIFAISIFVSPLYPLNHKIKHDFEFPEISSSIIIDSRSSKRNGDPHNTTEIQEFFDEDPKGWAANLLQQAKYELKKDFQQERANEQAEEVTNSLLNEYVKQNPEFQEAWDEGTLEDMCDKNPLHNPFSAFLQLKLDRQEAAHQAALKKAVEKATKETQEKVIANLRAKGHAASIDTDISDYPFIILLSLFHYIVC